MEGIQTRGRGKRKVSRAVGDPKELEYSYAHGTSVDYSKEVVVY